MNCYCANYYGSVGCRNTVSKFGDRCKLCVALKSGSSMKNGLLNEDDLWMVPEQPPHRSHSQNQMQRWASGSGGSGMSGASGGLRYGRK